MILIIIGVLINTEHWHRVYAYNLEQMTKADKNAEEEQINYQNISYPHESG